MNCRMFCVLSLLLSQFSLHATPNLGSAGTFSVLGATTVTNTGDTVLSGDLGLWGGTSITGFPPGIVDGTIHQTDGVAQQAQADALTAYNSLASSTPTQNLSGQDLGGKILMPGVYAFDSSAQLTGQLTLNTQGNPAAIFIFVIGSTLTTASGSSVVTSNGAACCNVYWVVGTSTTLGTTTNFLGNILANISITLDSGANIVDGSALALNGAVTLDDNNISNICAASNGVPEPGTVALLGAGLFAVVLFRRTSRKRAT